MDRIYMAALQMVPGIGIVRLKKLADFFGSASQAWAANRQELASCGFLTETICNKLFTIREQIDVQKLAAEWDAAGIKLCLFSDTDYPQLLRNIYNPPALIFYRGKLPVNDNLIAVVGARKASVYGKNVAQMLGAELASLGFGVISGAARGIDTAAHKGALTTGYTIAVLGSGVDVSYPPENKKLLDSIADKGAIISEYAPGTLPQAAFFPARNRIINGLSRGVVVVEAAEKSGALITADYALEEGRDVFAVPGSIFSDQSKGSHRLIKQGAKIIDCIEDIIEEYQVDRKQDSQTGSIDMTPEEEQVYQCLHYDIPLSIEEIVSQLSITIPVVTYTLLQLELRDLVVEHIPQHYVRAVREGIR